MATLSSIPANTGRGREQDDVAVSQRLRLERDNHVNDRIRGSERREREEDNDGTIRRRRSQRDGFDNEKKTRRREDKESDHNEDDVVDGGKDRVRQTSERDRLSEKTRSRREREESTDSGDDNERERRRGRDKSGRSKRESVDDKRNTRQYIFKDDVIEHGEKHGRDKREREVGETSRNRRREQREREDSDDVDINERPGTSKRGRDSNKDQRREREEDNSKDTDMDWKERRVGNGQGRKESGNGNAGGGNRYWRRYDYEDDVVKKSRVVEEKKSAVEDVERVSKPSGRSGGAYIPPFRLAQMLRDEKDKSSPEYQRLTWDALRKSINGLINKVNATNLKNIIPELFAENLIRGRGLFCRSCMKSQMASPAFSDVFAALVAVVNTKFPQVGSLLLKRIVMQLQRAYKRNDKPQLLAATKFIAHLVNQQVAHEIVALELLMTLLEKPTDDSVEVAVGFTKECGALLQDLSPKALHGIFESFRGILHEGQIDKRVQFLIEGLFAIRKFKFKDFPAVRPELDLVDQESQLTHELSLGDDEIDPETTLDIFRADPQYLENEKRYEELKRSMLGDTSSSEDEEGSDNASDDEDEEEDDEEHEEERMKIQDETETNLVNLRRTIYLTIMSSVDFEEAGHKLLKIKLQPGQEMEFCIMLLECCSQERTYLRYYGLLGQRFCMIKKIHQENFEKCFLDQYSMIHRLETNKLRNVAKFFAHLLGTDALPWHVLAYIRLTEEDTTSSSRIFIKILFQELSEHLGIRLLNERLSDPTMQDSFGSIFPKDSPKNTRFAINFFTSIGLGGITENLREYMQNMPRLIMEQQQKQAVESDVDSGSSKSSESGSSESDSNSSSESESDRDAKKCRQKRRRH